MKALNAHFTFSDIPIPTPRPGEALVHVHTFGVTSHDISQRSVLPLSQLGVEFSGRIEEFGGDQHADFRVGQAVFGLAIGGGAFAEYVVCPLDTLCPIPLGISYTVASAIPSAWFGALQLLQNDVEMKKRDKILVYNAMSPIGQAVVELAQILGCRRVFAVVNSTSAAKNVVKYLKFHTALPDEVIPLFDSPNLENEVSSYDVKGLNAIIDLRQKPTLSSSLRMLDKDGRLAIIDTPRALSSKDLKLIVYKRLRLHGVTFRARPPKFYKAYRDFIVKHIHPKLLNGQIKIRVANVYHWKKTKEAFELMETSSEIPGRIICSVVPDH